MKAWDFETRCMTSKAGLQNDTNQVLIDAQLGSRYFGNHDEDPSKWLAGEPNCFQMTTLKAMPA